MMGMTTSSVTMDITFTTPPPIAPALIHTSIILRPPHPASPAGSTTYPSPCAVYTATKRTIAGDGGAYSLPHGSASCITGGTVGRCSHSHSP